MITKKKARNLIVVAAVALLPLLLLLIFNLNPAFFAAASGWYGYNNQPVSPEPTALAAFSNYHGVSERNNSVHAMNGCIVQYLNGVLKFQADGISSTAPGFGFSHRPTYNNNHEWGTVSSNDGNMDMPNGWNWHTGLFFLIDMGGGEIRCVGPGSASSKYKFSSGTTYAGDFGVDAKIVHKTSTDEMILYGTNGATCYFYDFDSAHGVKYGGLKRIIDAYGNKLDVDYYTQAESSTLANLVQQINLTSADNTPGNKWVYTYINSTGNVNHRRIAKVELKDPSNALIAQVDYKYYDSSSTDFLSGSGSNGDLMKITVTESNSNGLAVVRNTLFRYWTGTWSSQNKGAAHKVKYIVEPQSYKELAGTVSDPLKATNSEVEPYADYYCEYDSTNFVTKATVRCGCSSCGGGGGTGDFLFSYATNGGWTTTSDFNVWKVSVTQANPDGTARIVDVNKAGSIINDVFQTDASYGSGDQRWITKYVFDSAGRITEIDHPSACQTYNSDHTVTLNSSTGLIELFTYTAGNLTARKLKQGSASSTYYWIESNTFASKSLSDHTIYIPVTREIFPADDTTGNEYVQATFDHSYWPDSHDLDGDLNLTEDSLAIQQTTVTNPDVVGTENGDADWSGTLRYYYYNALGQLEWERDETDSITYRTYDSELGKIASVTLDMNTTGYTLPTGWPGANGLSLTTTYSYLSNGRVAETTDPGDRTQRYHYTRLSAGEDVVISILVGTGDAGPASIAVYNLDGNLVSSATGTSPSGGSDLDADFNEGESLLETAFLGTLLSRTEYVYSQGQKVKERACPDPGDPLFPLENPIETLYAYDAMGRVIRVEDAEGTITRTYYTPKGKTKYTKIGTNDFGESHGSQSGTNNMTKVEEFLYDGQATVDSTNVGDGNLTKLKRFVNSTDSRDTVYTYDWRNRQTGIDGEESFYERRDYDNLNRVTAVYRYDTSLAGTLLAKSETKYDVLGRVYQTVVHELNSSGVVVDSLTTNSWYNARGELIKSSDPLGLFTKNVYNGAGQLKNAFVSYDTDETAYADAAGVVGDIVVSQTDYAYDDLGNNTLATRWERKSTDTSTGQHTTTTTAVRYYTASWYDTLGRLSATADYGTNGGSALTPPPTPPSSDADKLVTKYTYNDSGLLETTTEPAGNTATPDGYVTFREYDKLGRMVKLIRNYDDGVPGPNDLDLVESITYNDVSLVASRKTWRKATSGGTEYDQETAYDYGVTVGSRPDSDIASNNLLKRIRYADPATGDAAAVQAEDFHESFAYNAQGEQVYRKDQNGTVHGFLYDEIGRRTTDTASTLGTNVDGAILRIQTTYDPLDRATKITSYDAVSGGNLKNEIELIYNGFSQVKESRQEHSGAATGSSVKLLYNYSEADNGDAISRLNSMQYPGTTRLVYFHYDSPSGTDLNKLDWILNRTSGVSNNSSATSDRIGHYVYQGLGRVISKDCLEPTDSAKELYVNYTYDRFGRMENLTALSGSSVINDFHYSYDLNSKVASREENGFGGKDELYTNDGLDRLAIFDRGDLSGGAITNSVRKEQWTLDLVDNWDSLTTNNGTPVARTHNRANEITDVDGGYSGGDPTHDKSGNTTFIDRAAPAARTFVYDAWNRLVRVKEGAVVKMVYHYDGLGRRIRSGEDASNPDFDYYYSESWQLLSERTGSPRGTLREYVWGPQYVDEILERDEDKTPLDGDTRDGTDESLFYVQDRGWNVHSICDKSGSKVERYLYDPYGAVSFYGGSWSSLSSSAYGNRVLFGGRLLNAPNYETHTYDYRSREYSPHLGRFMQRDPIGIWGDDSAGNGYAYVKSSPMNYVDPTGQRGQRHFADMGHGPSTGVPPCHPVCTNSNGRRRGTEDGRAATSQGGRNGGVKNSCGCDVPKDNVSGTSATASGVIENDDTDLEDPDLLGIYIYRNTERYGHEWIEYFSYGRPSDPRDHSGFHAYGFYPEQRAHGINNGVQGLPWQGPEQHSGANGPLERIKWNTKRSTSGKLLAGPGMGTDCFDAFHSDRWNCIFQVALVWDEKKHSGFWKNCRHFVSDIESSCCFSRKDSIVLPGRKGAGGSSSK